MKNISFLFFPNGLKNEVSLKKIIKRLSPKNEKLLMCFKHSILTRLLKSVLDKEGNKHTFEKLPAPKKIIETGNN